MCSVEIFSYIFPLIHLQRNVRVRHFGKRDHSRWFLFFISSFFFFSTRFCVIRVRKLGFNVGPISELKLRNRFFFFCVLFFYFFNSITCKLARGSLRNEFLWHGRVTHAFCQLPLFRSSSLASLWAYLSAAASFLPIISTTSSHSPTSASPKMATPSPRMDPLYVTIASEEPIFHVKVACWWNFYGTASPLNKSWTCWKNRAPAHASGLLSYPFLPTNLWTSNTLFSLYFFVFSFFSSSPQYHIFLVHFFCVPSFLFPLSLFTSF